MLHKQNFGIRSNDDSGICNRWEGRECREGALSRENKGTVKLTNVRYFL